MNIKALPLNAWDQMLDGILRFGFVRVNRSEWLSDVLYPFLSIDQLEQLAEARPADFLSVKVINHVANQEILSHTQTLAMGSAGSTLSGYLATWLSIPTEIAQYSVNMLILVQKLAYLYGWDDFLCLGSATAETRARLTFLIGSLLGVRAADDVLVEAIRAHRGMVSMTPIPSSGRASAIEEILMQISRAYLILSVKSVTSAILSKKFPLIGAAVGAGSSYLMTKPSVMRLKVLLREAMTHTLQ